MVNKRVSVKGKGAELFFGDYHTDPSALPDSTSSRDVSANHEETPPATTQLHPLPSPASSSPTAHNPETPPVPPAKRFSQQLTRQLASSPASELASSLDPINELAIGEIRKTLKTPGREVSFVRLTPAEKQFLADIIYHYKQNGRKTTETEINRIAINYLVRDFHTHGDDSVLARVLAALLA